MPWDTINQSAIAITAIIGAFGSLHKLGHQLGLWRRIRNAYREYARRQQQHRRIKR